MPFFMPTLLSLLFIIDFRFFILKIAFFVLKFVVVVFVSSSYDSIISSHVINKSSIILAKYFPFPQLHVAGFQM